MFEPKLTVFNGKIFNYVKQAHGLFDTRQNIAIANKLVVGFRQRPVQWKLTQSTCFCTKKEEKPVGRVFSAIFRCLNFSVAAIVCPYPKFSKFWKLFLSPMPVTFRTIWITNTKNASVRGFNGKAFDGKDSSPELIDNSHRQINETVSAMLGLPEDKPPKRNKEPEITREWVKKKLTPEPLNVELPPPRRCRLGCPLPPDEFNPPGEPVPLHRFRNLVHVESPTQQPSKEDPKSNEPVKVTTEAAVSPNQNTTKQKKNYFNSDGFKSNVYTPQMDINRKMNALLFEPVSLSLNYDLVNAPTKLYPDEILIQVVYSGVNGTDVFITEGKVPCGNEPVILGHEISGRVYATGRDVHHVKKGDAVAVNAYSSCCICRYCSRGLSSSCLKEGFNNSIGVFKNGGWAEYVVVKKSQVHKIPRLLGLDQAALVQPLSCVMSAMSKLNILYGMDIFIQGLGLSGCLWASLLHFRGHKNVFVTDKSDKRRAQFESLELEYDFIPPEDIIKQNADVIIECSGSPKFIEKSFNIVNSNGKLCFFGKPNPMMEVRCIPYDLIKKEVTILGNSGNAFCFTEALDVAASMGYRYLDFDRLGVHTFPLKDYREAFQLKKAGEASKIVFKIES